MDAGRTVSVAVLLVFPFAFVWLRLKHLVEMIHKGKFQMKIKGIHHVAIIASDYGRSKDFYVRILGFKPVQEVYREERESYKLDLEVASRYQIELFSFPNPAKRPSYPEAAGLRHLAFEVDSVEEAVAYLASHQVAVEPIRIDPTTNKKFTFFQDPDDLPIEVYEA